jgi:hypothetical protein
MVDNCRHLCGIVCLIACTYYALATGNTYYTSKQLKCFNKLQADLDCVLENGSWEPGEMMDYEYQSTYSSAAYARWILWLLYCDSEPLMKTAKKEAWFDCGREVSKYVWQWDDSACAHTSAHINPVYSREQMCTIMRGRNLMIVGDSINNQLYVTFGNYTIVDVHFCLRFSPRYIQCLLCGRREQPCQTLL